MFDYEVLTESEAMQERYQLLPDGEYSAVISSPIDKISQNSGNPMIEVILTVYDANGKDHTVKDYLSYSRSMAWKMIHCAESAGKLQEYKDKKFCADVIRGCNVKVRIGTEKGGEIPIDKLKGKAPGARYPDKNKVEDYIVGSVSDKPVVANTDGFLDEEIPF
jgi:hypothetical protein